MPAKKATKKAPKKPAKKPVKKPAKKAAVKKPAKKVTARKPKKAQEPVKDVAVSPVVDPSGVVTMNPVPGDVVNWT